MWLVFYNKLLFFVSEVLNEKRSLLYLSLVKVIDIGERDFMIGKTEHDVQFFTSSYGKKK